jgi:beta-lactamase superfamily II metal-dependent hydrolase
MFAIELLPAGEGDALVVEYGTEFNERYLLVDGGPVLHWPQVRERLLKRRDACYEAVVVSHIDEDHIGGVLKLLEDPDLRRRVDAIWFNGYAHCGPHGSVLGPIHGEQLTGRITQDGYDWNPGFANPPTPHTGGAIVVREGLPLPTIRLRDGAVVTLLAPTQSQLQRLGREWEKVVTKAGLVPGAGAGAAGSHVRKKNVSARELPIHLDREVLRQLAARRQVDASAANGSSVAFVLEYEGKRVLLTGDAHPGGLLEGLKKYAKLTGERRPRFDLVKLPHHGSGANVTSALVNAIDADRYLISSNGDGWGHPDDAAVARLILGSPRPVTLVGNYASNCLRTWAQRGSEVGLTVVLPESGTGIRVPV